MAGLLLLSIFIAWLLATLWLSKRATQTMAISWKRHAARIGLLTILLPLPLVDEIIGGFQFRALCEKNAVFQMGVSNPEGRVTKYVGDPVNELVPGTAIRIYRTHAKFIDIQSDEVVVQFDEYTASGGKFIRALSISEGNAPLTIGIPACSPEQKRGEAVHRTMQFSVIN